MGTAAAVASMIRQAGQRGTLVQYADSYDPATGVNTRTETTFTNIPMHVRTYRPDEIAGTIQQGDRQVRVSPTDLPRGVAPARLNELRLGTGETLRIEFIDPRAGVGEPESLYIMQCRGA